jgi:integration host factor subunit alpha
LDDYLPLQPIGASPMTTTKADLINAVAEANGFPLNRSTEIIEKLLELINTKLAAGEDVLISGFGKFYVKKSRERKGRNPAFGEMDTNSMILKCFYGMNQNKNLITLCKSFANALA